MVVENYSTSFKIVVTLLAYSATAALFPELNRIALYVALPIAFVLTLFDMKNTENCIKGYTKYLYWMYGLIFFSYIYATYKDASLYLFHALLGVLLLIFIFVRQSNSLRKIAILYGVYVCLYLAMMYYMQTNILSIITFGEQRVDDEELNANTIAYYTFYVTFAIFALGDLVEHDKIRKLCRIAFIGTIPLSLYIALATASRQVLIIQIPLILLLLYIRHYRQVSSSTKLTSVIVLVLTLFVFSTYVLNSFEGSLLVERAQNESIEDDPRALLMKDAFNIGMDNFFTGVGAGNYIRYSYSKHFSHCTFTELFANNGIICVLLYTIMLLKFLFTQIKRYRVHKDNMFLVFGVFSFIFIIDNIFYVYYQFLWLMGFLILVMSHSEVYYKERYLSKTI